jgi:uncharacterized protein with PIN domain
MATRKAHFRFYEELNDFLPPEKRKKSFDYLFNGKPAIKDAIEALGIPHTEVELILVNGESEDFSYHLREGDRVSVYPVFESFDITEKIRLRPKALRSVQFIADVHLGKLARLLRMMGFDTLYRNDYFDDEIIRISQEEKRVILTRDRGILKTGTVTHGCYIHPTDPRDQLSYVIKRFDLFRQIKPFYRCMVCNERIKSVEKSRIVTRLPARTAQYYSEFFQCTGCGKIYWKGSHYQKMIKVIKRLYG